MQTLQFSRETVSSYPWIHSPQRAVQWILLFLLLPAAGLAQENTPPSVSAIANQIGYAGLAMDPIGFSINDTETDPSDLLLSVASSDLGVLDPESHVTVTAGDPASPSRSLQINPPAGNTGTATITVEVTDGELASSVSFELDIRASIDDSLPAFLVGSHVLSEGGSRSIPFSVRNFDNIFTFQFSFHWDPSVIQFETLGGLFLQDLQASNFGVSNVENGVLTVSWDTALGASLADGAVLFEIVMKAVNEAGTSSALTFNDNPTVREVSASVEGGGVAVVDSNMLPGNVDIIPGSPPSIQPSPIPPQTTSTEVPIVIDLTVSDDETPAEALTVEAFSGDQEILPDGNLEVTGTGANRALTITPLFEGVVQVTVEANDGFISAIETFQLTVAAPDPENAAPVISSIADRQTNMNSPLEVAFSVTDDLTPAADLIVEAFSSNPDVVGNGGLSLQRDGSDFALSVIPNLDATGTAVISVQANDGNRLAAQTFQLDVLEAPVEDILVTNANDAGAGSLREAIERSNSLADRQTILFDIPGEGPHRIALGEPLPPILDAATLDGFSQPGSLVLDPVEGDQASPQIVIDGAATEFGNGLDLLVGGNVIQGLVIQNFAGHGINIEGSEASADNNSILGNRIGTDAGGGFGAGNLGAGIRIASSSGNVIGAPGYQGNLISANNDGVLLEPGAAGNAIQGNYIGTDASGALPIPNSGSGLYVQDSGNLIIGNHIGFNGDAGVSLDFESAPQGVRITNNSIFDNAGAGINLGEPGGNPNDPGDADEGPNRLQNAPVIQSAALLEDGSVNVQFAIFTDPASANYPLAVEFFAADSTGEQGRRYLDFTSYIESNAQQPVTVNLFSPDGLTASDKILATATDADGNTSEFSNAVRVQQPLVEDTIYQNIENDLGTALPFSGEEIGDEVILDNGPFEQIDGAVLSEAVIEFNMNLEGDSTQMIFSIYKNDGPSQGSGAFEPGTLVYSLQTPYHPSETERQTLNLSIGVVVPRHFTWTLAFPDLGANDTVSLPLAGPPEIGNNFTDYWQFDDGQWSLNGIQDLDGSFIARFQGYRLQVAEDNNPPSPALDDYFLDEGGTLEAADIFGVVNGVNDDGVLVNDFDPDDDPLFAVLLTPPFNAVPGTFVFNRDGSFHYEHDGSENQFDTFSILVSDGQLVAQSFVDIHINPIDDETPVLVHNEILTVNKGETSFIPPEYLTADDPDSELGSLEFQVTVPPANGILQLADNPGVPVSVFPQANIFDGLLEYAHDGSHAVADSIQFDVEDPAGNRFEGGVFSFEILNNPPTANDDQFEIDRNAFARLDVLANDTAEPDSNEALEIVSVGSAVGTISILPAEEGAGPAIGYEPLAGFAGEDVFAYEISDGFGGSDTATVTVIVSGDNAPPTVSGIPDQTIDQDTGTGDLPFTVQDDFTPLDQLTITPFSSDPEVIPASNVVISGEGENRLVSATPLPGTLGIVEIELQVADTEDGVTSRFFEVRVVPVLPTLFVGAGIDGYVSGGTVFFDADLNFELGLNEPFATTDTQGKFILDIQAGQFDLNGNFILDLEEGALRLFGGVDIATGQPNRLTMSAPPGSTVISPLTTVLTEMRLQDPSLDQSAASALLNAQLGLSAGIDVTQFDPFAAAANNNADAPAFIAAASKVYDAATLLASLTGDSEAALLVTRKLADLILNESSPDLSDSATLATVLGQAVAALDIGLSQDDLDAAVRILAELNQRKDAALDSDPNILQSAANIVRVQVAAQTSTISDFAAVQQGSLTMAEAESRNTGEALDGLIANAVVGDLTGSGDSAGAFEFLGNASVAENGVVIEPLTVVRRDGNRGEVLLEIRLLGRGTTSPDSDYTASVFNVLFEDRQVTANVDFTGILIDDNVLEDLETDLVRVLISPGTPTQAQIGSLGDVTLEIHDNDHPPVAVQDSASTLEDHALTLAFSDMTANDSDSDIPFGDILSVTGADANSQQGGTVEFQPANEILVYQPPLNFHGLDEFHYTLSDAQGNTSQGVVTVDIQSVNDLPAIGTIPDQITNHGRGLARLPFQVSDVEDAPESLIVRAASSDQSVVSDSNLILEGSGADRFLTVIPDGAAGQTVVTVEVEDTNSGIAQQLFTVVVVERSLTIEGGRGGLGESISAFVKINADGTEQVIDFSVQFNPAVVQWNDAFFSFQVLNANADAVVDASLAGQGLLGFTIDIPAGQSLPPGSNEMVELVFEPLAGAVETFVPLAFADSPVARRLLNSDAGALITSHVNGGLEIFLGLEADVTPMPIANVDGVLSVTDWIAVNNAAADRIGALDGREFAAFDCAPARGDGVIDLLDAVQAGRYIVGLDDPSPVGGPSSPTETGPGSVTLMSSLPKLPIGGVRRVSVSDVALESGRTGFATVTLEGTGVENALAFTLLFDAQSLECLGAQRGDSAGGGLLTVNDDRLDEGLLGVILALNPGDVFAFGRNEALRIAFKAKESATPIESALVFGSQLAARQVVSANAQSLSADFLNARVFAGGNGAWSGNAACRVQIAGRDEAGRLILQIDGPSGTVCVLEASRNFDAWETLELLELSGGPHEYVDRRTPDASECFYRVRSLQTAAASSGGAAF